MPSEAHRILREALLLPDDEREALADALRASLAPARPGLDPRWQAEVATRRTELGRGEVAPVSFTDVDARIRRSLAGR